MSQQHSSMTFERHINRRLTRSGWFFIVVVIALLFLSLYFLVPNLRKPTNSTAALEERIQMLEQKVEQLESALLTSPN